MKNAPYYSWKIIPQMTQNNVVYSLSRYNDIVDTFCGLSLKNNCHIPLIKT